MILNSAQIYAPLASAELPSHCLLEFNTEAQADFYIAPIFWHDDKKIMAVVRDDSLFAEHIRLNGKSKIIIINSDEQQQTIHAQANIKGFWAESAFAHDHKDLFTFSSDHLLLVSFEFEHASKKEDFHQPRLQLHT